MCSYNNNNNNIHTYNIVVTTDGTWTIAGCETGQQKNQKKKGNQTSNARPKPGSIHCRQRESGCAACIIYPVELFFVDLLPFATIFWRLVCSKETWTEPMTVRDFRLICLHCSKLQGYARCTFRNFGKTITDSWPRNPPNLKSFDTRRSGLSCFDCSITSKLTVDTQHSHNIYSLFIYHL